MDMPKPSEGHLMLSKLAGVWEGGEIMHPSRWDPKGGVAVGRRRNSLSLGGFALICEYEQERDGIITFTGHGVFTYDANENLYSLHWFDCMGSPAELFVGQFEGDVLALAHGGPGMHARFTCDLSTAGTMRSTMEMSPGGSDWKTLFEATYRHA